jgi:hypothetical protein
LPPTVVFPGGTVGSGTQSAGREREVKNEVPLDRGRPKVQRLPKRRGGPRDRPTICQTGWVMIAPRRKLLSYKAASTMRARASKIAPEGRGSRCLVRPIGARFRITFKRLRRARTISVENVAYSGLSISRSAGRSHAPPYPLPASVPCSLQGRGIPSPDESALRVIRVTGTCRPGDGALPPSSGIASHQP